MTIAAIGSVSGRLFYIFDRSSSMRFRNDTSAKISVISLRPEQYLLRHTTLTLQAAYDPPIKTRSKTADTWSKLKAMFSLGFRACRCFPPDPRDGNSFRFWRCG